VPYRGRTNQPAYVTETGTFLADLLGIEPEEFARITTQNFFDLFPRAKETWVPPK
jgi:TatD DNase family protein